MATSKSPFPDALSTIRSRSAPPSILEPVHESDEETQAVPKTVQLLKRSSRLQRLSSYLPHPSRYTLSKSQQDSLQSAIPRRPVPPMPPRKPSPTRPPSESPPPLPPKGYQSATPTTTNKLRKPDSPSRLNPSPGAQSPRHGQHSPAEAQARSRANSLVPPANANLHQSGGTPPEESGKKRKSWLAGKVRSRNTSQDHGQRGGSNAWINDGTHDIDYNLSLLTTGEMVPELCDEFADTYVYLFPRASGRGPSFKVPSTAISSSQPLIDLIRADPNYARGRRRSTDNRRRSTDNRASLTIEDATRNLTLGGHSPDIGPLDRQQFHLYIPLNLNFQGAQFSQQDTQRLIDIRNLFAFLTGQPLVRTPICPTTYGMFLVISSLLQQYGFTNTDGSTYGEAASTSFSFFLEDLGLADVKQSREKTIEGIILGERMRSTELYNEAFAHAVGKYSDLQDVKSSLFDSISPSTRNKLERASLDLTQRQKAADLRLLAFEFPSLFAGIAASTSSAESKFVRFKAWKSNFMALRKQVLSYYKDMHGQWPPKASSKKNQFVEGGLNRLVLKGLYADLCSLYDLLADRESLTTRSYDTSNDDSAEMNVDPTASALRRLLGEFDRSSPPVQPPVPFDLPRVPTMTTVEPNYPSLSPKDQFKSSTRKLKDYESLLILAKSHNLESDHQAPFLQMFHAFETKESRGKHAQELADQRYGYWVFIYAVIQSLPMLVVDAPGLKYTSGVEYFLCEPPMGNLPWMDDGAAVKMAWYGVQGGQGVVSLPSDVVNHGVEAIYRRSHCWTVAEHWISAGDNAPPSPSALGLVGGGELSPLSPPPGFANAELGMRPSARGRHRSTSDLKTSQDGLRTRSNHRSRSRQDQRNSIALGLERLPGPDAVEGWGPAGPPPLMVRGSPGSSPHMQYAKSRTPSESHVRSASESWSKRGSTFDDILGGGT